MVLYIDYMGAIQSVSKASYEDVLYGINHKYIIISVISDSDSCLIKGTLSPMKEESTINSLYQYGKLSPHIIVYGENDHDCRIYKKYKQLKEIGFINVFIYPGGMFEWLLLQDVYSIENFPTTKTELDLLKFKPVPNIDI